MTKKRILILVTILLVISIAIIVYAVNRSAYWDGGDYAGRPVYSSSEGITKEGHQELKKCGLNDDQAYIVKQATNRHRCEGTTADGGCIMGMGKSYSQVVLEGGILGKCYFHDNGETTVILTKYQEGGEGNLLGTLLVGERTTGIYEFHCYCNLTQK
ncbi:hypothetical protein AMJ83_11735 [candidate division WOR_3 bacterium SM23_42]|uniref:Uncharacterized protein n=1 Tax=candidate division WOR_3 bacterium SM23_42 TaxID=1703779 RepID=A0A0S8FMQ6_UNCW3|nr:MAG: hypothetical protein AMJ83_11735 [candidate division WOR_3 bacterium SM23_42]